MTSERRKYYETGISTRKAAVPDNLVDNIPWSIAYGIGGNHPFFVLGEC